MKCYSDVSGALERWGQCENTGSYKPLGGRQGVIFLYALADLVIHYDERRVRYGKPNSVGGLSHHNQGKGEER